VRVLRLHRRGGERVELVDRLHEVAAANRAAASPQDSDIAALTKDLPNNHQAGAPPKG